MAIGRSNNVAVCARFAEAVLAPLSLTHPARHYFRADGGTRPTIPNATHAGLPTRIVLFAGEDEASPEPRPHVALAQSLLARLPHLVA